TAADGSVTLPFTAESPGAIQLTVSGRNLRTFLGAIPVGNSTGPYAHWQSMTVDDDNTAGTSGNGGGQLDAGETVDLLLTLRNDGGSAAPVSGTVTSTDPNVTVLVGGFSTPSVPSGGTAVATAPVRIRVGASAPDHHVVDLQLSMNAGATA